MAQRSLPSLVVGGTPAAADSFERALLDSARSDEVPAQARQRVALALGIGWPMPGSMPSPSDAVSRGPAGEGFTPEGARSVVPEAQRASSSIAAGSIAAGSGSARLTLAGKAALVGLAGGLVLLLAHPNDVPARPPGSAASVTPHTVVAAAPVAPPVVQDSSISSLLAAGPLEQRDVSDAVNPAAPGAGRKRAGPAAPTRRRGPANQAVTSAADGQSRLLAEVAWLDRARAALVASDAPLVLQHIESYTHEFPDGVLAREAARLEARARALASGSDGRARDIGEAR